jgi:hypothetical protein
MIGIILTTLIFIGVLAACSTMSDVKKVKENWEEYRCRPDVMLMADYYGHNSSDNLQFCLKDGFDKRAAQAIGPFYTYLQSFVNILMTMLQSLNSIRMIFATIVGSVTKIFTEFSTRIEALFYRFQITAMRMKFLMSRVFATMYAVIFMGMAGIKATQNFGNTFLFKFLDTFCFDPSTLVNIRGKGAIAIRNVSIGDVFTTGERVTATFQFEADGQTMVRLGDTLVSTNHYLLHNGKWIRADAHPDAVKADDWSGGVGRPLICLNTDTHSFPVGAYTFRDYDETELGDEESMKMAMDMLNGKEEQEQTKSRSSSMACRGSTLLRVVTSKGTYSVPANGIILGTQLSHGKVIAIVKKECSEVCSYNGEWFAAGTAVWADDKKCWVRVSSVAEPLHLDVPETFYSFVVTPSACIETANGMFRDYLEVHTDELEKPYSSILESQVA